MVYFYFDINIFFEKYSDNRNSRETERKKPALKRALFISLRCQRGSFPLEHRWELQLHIDQCVITAKSTKCHEKYHESLTA